MYVFFMAAGFGTRLYPLTEYFPKPLLPVRGKPILDWFIDDIENDASVYVIVTNHKFAKVYENHFKKKGYFIVTVDDGMTKNETRRGTIRDISYVLDKNMLWSDDILIIEPNALYDFSMRGFLDYVKAKGTSCTMRYWEEDEEKLRRSGVSVVDRDDLLTGYEVNPSHPKSHWASVPIYYFKARDARRIHEFTDMRKKRGMDLDDVGNLIEFLRKRVPMHSMEMPGKRYEIMDRESYVKTMWEYEGIEHRFIRDTRHIIQYVEYFDEDEWEIKRPLGMQKKMAAREKRRQEKLAMLEGQRNLREETGENDL